MPERDNDPIANTQMFRAFVQRGESEPATRRSRLPVTIMVIVAVLVLVALVVAVLLAR